MHQVDGIYEQIVSASGLDDHDSWYWITRAFTVSLR
jgi:hypothetical protein